MIQSQSPWSLSPTGRLACVLLAAMGAAACTEPLEFADWTLPVPEGTRIIEYAHVALEERTERLELVADDITPEVPFYRRSGLAVDDQGRVYVLDGGDKRVVALDQDGSARFMLGQEGQGPGELQVPNQIAISADRVIVSDVANGRLSIWDVDGTHIADPRYQSASLFSIGLHGTIGGGLVSRSLGRKDGASVEVVSSLSHEAGELVRFAELPRGSGLEWRGGAAPGNDSYFEGRVDGAGTRTRVMPVVAVDRAGSVYVSRADEYQVIKYQEDGSTAWALRVAAPAVPFPDEESQAIIARFSEDYPGLRASQFGWPERLPALADLRVDGHGHLFVFPFEYTTLDAEDVPVDVYGRDGERLFTGIMARRDARWAAAHGDFVFRLSRDPANDEATIARRRIVETF